MGYVWLIAERSELLKQYLCRLLVRTFVPVESSFRAISHGKDLSVVEVAVLAISADWPSLSIGNGQGLDRC
jgi:hypothetical protein